MQHSGFVLPATLTGYLWLKGHQPWIPGFSCLLRHATGIPCPTCYLTRATCFALAGNWSESVHYHLFGPAVAASLLVWAGLSLRQKRFIPNGLPKLQYTPIAIALIAYWITRLIYTYRLNEASFLSFPN
ncbi:MAG: DUF2752 domain-containing protein [Synechococcus sp. BS307-5m-G37]|nr:DUF2752 domain-containing protein [Synechococcus sp. BS307-5m-G37]